MSVITDTTNDPLSTSFGNSVDILFTLPTDLMRMVYEYIKVFTVEIVTEHRYSYADDTVYHSILSVRKPVNTKPIPYGIHTNYRANPAPISSKFMEVWLDLHQPIYIVVEERGSRLWENLVSLSNQEPTKPRIEQYGVHRSCYCTSWDFSIDQTPNISSSGRKLVWYASWLN